MAKSIFIGYILRAWTETAHGWDSKIFKVDTRERAEKYARYWLNRPFKVDEYTRKYEIYKDYNNDEWFNWEAQ